MAASSLHAEFLALLEGLLACKELIVTSLRVEVDCKVLVDVLVGKVSCPWFLIHILRKIQVILQEWNFVQIHHVYRELN